MLYSVVFDIVSVFFFLLCFELHSFAEVAILAIEAEEEEAEKTTDKSEER